MMNAQNINQATSLDELMTKLEEIQASLDEDTTIDEVLDMGNLPTFGGDEPHNTNNFWSGDANRVLTTRDGSQFYICNRSDWS